MATKQKDKLKGMDSNYNNINNTLKWRRIYPDLDYVCGGIAYIAISYTPLGKGLAKLVN